MLRLVIISILHIALAAELYCQRTQLVSFDYTKADSIAINFPRSRIKDAGEFAKALTANLDTDHEKYRAIFRWIATNVEYRKGRQTTDANEVLKKKKAVCEGYASLLEAMCHAVDIRCETVTGYSKSLPRYDLPKKMKNPGHAWNAVFLAGEWHLTDATWAAGYIDQRGRKFVQEFNENWYLPDADWFIRSHYPIDERWMLHDIPFKKKRFKKEPIVLHSAFVNDINIGSKPKSKIRSKLKLIIQTESEIEWASIQFLGDEENYGVLLRRSGENYHINYQLDKEKSGPFVLYFNGEPSFVFIKK